MKNRDPFIKSTALIVFSAWLLVFTLQIQICSAQKNGLYSYIDSDGEVRPIKTEKELRIKRLQVLDRMQQVMGPLPDRSLLETPKVAYIDTVRVGIYYRYKIILSVAAEEEVPAYLYLPVEVKIPESVPAMLALHPTGALGKGIVDGESNLKNRAYAKELAERGYVVIAPDYPGFGDLKDYDFERDRYTSGTMKGVFDAMRCVDFLESLPMVDKEKIGVIGHSLGGHNAIFAGAFDERLKIIISSCGWTPFHDYFNGDSAALNSNGGALWPWAQDKYMPLVKEKFGLDPDKMPFDFDEIISTFAPRFFLSNSPLYDANFNVDGVKRGINRILQMSGKLGFKDHLKVEYPSSTHDFPPEVRQNAYQWADSIFNFTYMPYSYLDNSSYSVRVKQFEKDKKHMKVVLLGNSLTQRGDWQELLGRTDVANRGIGSDITEGFIKRIRDVFSLKPKVCFIEGGVNDLARYIPVDTIIHNLSYMIDILRKKKIVPVLVTANLVADNYQYMAPSVFNDRIKALNKEMRMLAEKKGVSMIDLTPLISDGRHTLQKFVVKDGIHYNAEAYQLWANEINKVLSMLKL